MSKINSSLQKLSEDPKTTSSVTEPVQLASTPGMTPLKVVLVGLILEGSMPILRTAVHQDSGTSCEPTMANAGGVVPLVESDRAGGPWIKLRGNWLHRVYIP